MKTTHYFAISVMARRPYLKEEWIEYVLNNPIRKETQVMDVSVIGHSSLKLESIFELSSNQTEKQYTTHSLTTALSHRM